jgi:hypothetical protein
MRIFATLAGLLMLGGSLQAGSISGVACPSAPTSLSSYQSTFASFEQRCDVGVLSYYDFQFQSLMPSASPVDGFNDLIQVTPSTSGSGLFFSSAYQDAASMFSATGLTAVRYAIQYIVDPAPIIGGEQLTLDPPLGDILVREYICKDTTFYSAIGVNPPTCATGASPYTLTVYPPLQYTDLVMFGNSPAAMLHVRQIIEIGFNPTLNSEPFSGFDGTGSDQILAGIPEPWSFPAVALGLLGVWGYRRRRR